MVVFTKLREDYVPICFHPNNCGDLMIFGNRAFPDIFELSFIRKDVVQPVNASTCVPAEPHANTTVLPEIHIGALLD